jgi:hypothetical protein
MFPGRPEAFRAALATPIGFAMAFLLSHVTG